ncbi:MAG: MFS transporter [Thermoleophilaceae bacterium]|nr:MFS transporter [Thermoleophilaceae bacterium]
MADSGTWRLSNPPVIGWVLYDFANTIFSFVVVTRYFGDWIVDERGHPDIYIGLMTAAVSVALVIALPAIGARVDRRARHKPVLIGFTLLSVAATALLGVVEPVLIALVVGGIATFAFNTADSQYHPLLGVVAPQERRGRVSGIAVAVGYLGTLTALFAIGAMVDDGEAQRAFIPAALLFGLFALPCFFLVRERRAPPPPGELPKRGPFAELAASLRRARGAPHGRLLLARFLYVDAIATVIQFLVVYARRTGEFDGTRIDALLAVSTVASIAGAIGAGLAAERVGAKRVIIATLVVTIAALVGAAVSGAGAALWVAGPLVGAALGSLSSVDRVLMLRLIPAESRGEDFGLYAIAGKLSTGFGPLVLWGGTILVLTEFAGLSKFDASRVAVAVLAGSALAGLLVLRPLRDPSVPDVTH